MENHKYFETNEEFIQYIKERSDDIEKAFVLSHPRDVNIENNGSEEIVENVSMILYLINGSYFFVDNEDADSIIRDGILDRMRITSNFIP